MMMKFVEEYQTNSINNESQHGYSNKTVVLDLNRLEDSLNALTKNIVTYEHQEDSVE